MKLRYLIIVICIVIGYFLFNYFYIDDNKIKSDVIKQLNKKYDDKFYISNFMGPDESIDFYRIYLFSEKYPDYDFYATCVIENHKCHVYDNYQRYIYNENIKSYVDDSLNSVYNNYKLFLDIDDDMVLDKKYGNINDYLSGQVISLSLFVSELEYYNRTGNIEVFRENLKNHNIRANITVMYVDDDKLVNINDNNYKTYMMSLEDINSYSSFYMDEDFNFNYNVWSD